MKQDNIYATIPLCVYAVCVLCQTWFLLYDQAEKPLNAFTYYRAESRCQGKQVCEMLKLHLSSRLPNFIHENYVNESGNNFF
jgi:hypothetical protein